MAKGLSAAKAKKILKDGYVKGKPLTAKQKKYFGAIASGATPLKAIDGADVEKAQWGRLLKWGKELYDTARGIDKITDVAKVSEKLKRYSPEGANSFSELMRTPINKVPYFKLNPNSFKPDPNNFYYRGIGKTGIDDAINSGVVRPPIGSQFGDDLYMSANVNVADKYASDATSVFNKNYSKSDADPTKYIAEIPITSLTNLNSKEAFKRMNKLGSTFHEYVEPNSIPSSEVNFYKENWLKGYKKLNFQNGGWLDKFDNGGVQPNYNDSNVSLPPGFKGWGYDKGGRAYNGAWDGPVTRMGGTIPGATGMMYARTSGTSPEEPKKAQNGKVIDWSKQRKKYPGFMDNFKDEIEYDPKFVDFDSVRRAVRNVESLDGKLMWNPESTATGLYGQRFSEIKNDYSGTRRDFVKDTVAQNEFFKRRFYDGLEASETTPLLQDANDLYNDYSPQIKNFPYSKEDIAVLSNFIGRGGTRKYLGYAIRDGKPLAEALPNIYGPSAKQSNKTPEEYLELARQYYKTNELKNGGRCWPGYKTVSGKTPFSKGSCQKAQDGTIQGPISKRKDFDGNWLSSMAAGNQRKNSYGNLGDLYRYFGGMDLKNKALYKSKYKPTNSKNPNAEYIAIKDSGFTNTVLDQASRIFVDGNIKSTNEYGDDYIDRKINDDTYGIPRQPGDAGAIGKFFISRGSDEEGDYISYYDVFDVGQPNSPNTFGELLGSVKPFEIYDRIYVKKDKKGRYIQKKNGGDVPKAQDGTSMISQYEEPAWYEKLLDYAASPMTTLGYLAKGQDLPDRIPINVPGRSEFDNWTFDTINPAAYIKYGASALRNLDKGEYLDATFDAVSAIPILPAFLKRGKKLPVKGIDLEKTPFINAFTKPTRSVSGPLPKELEPYLSRRVYPFNKEQEVFESFLSTDRQLKNIDSKSINYDLDGNIIPKNFESSIDWKKWVKYTDDFDNNPDVIKHLNEIEKTTKANGTWMKNPDGSAFKGTQEEFVIQQSDNFKKAFPNPVVDDAGNPLINYHGSGSEFNVFDESKFYSGTYGKGVYTSPNKDGILKSYANPNKNRTKKIAGESGTDEATENLYELYINSKNPLTTDDILDFRNFGKTVDELPSLKDWKNSDFGKKMLAENTYLRTDDDIISFIRMNTPNNPVKESFIDQGGDFLRAVDSQLQEGVTPFSNQMKSAKGNILFDMTNPNIYKAIVPAAIGTAASQMTGPVQEDGEFKNGGWLDKYQDGGSLDKVQNLNEVDLGTFRYVKSEDDPRYKAFQDSSQLYNKYKRREEAINQYGNWDTPTTLRKFYNSLGQPVDIVDDNIHPKINSTNKKTITKYAGDISPDKVTPTETSIRRDYDVNIYNEPNEKVILKGSKEDKRDRIKYGYYNDFGEMKFDVLTSDWNSKQRHKKAKNKTGFQYFQDGGVIEDNRGQWAYPGEITKINSNNITMKGVNYPVLGISDTGDKKMMQPGKDYKFDGNSVTEYPMAQQGAGVNKEGVKQYKWFKNYLQSPKYVERLKKEFPDYTDKQIGQEVKSRLENVMQTRVGFLPRSSDISTDVGDVQGVYNADEYPGSIMLRPEYSASTSDVLFEPGNYLSGYNTIPLHEWSHAADDGGNRMPQSTTDLMLSKMKENILDIPKDKYYYTKPTEYLGRMQPLRYLMQEEGLYDAGTQDFTKEDLEKAKQNKTIKNNVHFQDLMNNIKSDEDFIELMNKVASVDNSVTEYPMAQNGTKTKIYNEPIEQEEGIIASIDNFITPIVRSLTNRQVGTRDDINLRIPPGEMKYFSNNQKPVNSNYIIGGDYMEDTPTAYKASEYPNTMYTTNGETQEIDFETQQFYGVVDGNIKLGKKADFKDDDVIVPLRPNFGGNFSIKEREPLDPKFIEEARKFNKVTNEIRESAYFSPEQKVWEEMNGVTFAKKYIPPFGGYEINPEYKDIIDQVDKKFGKGSYMYDLEPFIKGYNSTNYSIYNPAGNQLDTFGNKVILFDPESNEHLFISNSKNFERNKKIVDFKKKYPNAKYLNLDNGRFTNYMVNKDGITSDDATEYMQNSFKGPDATGYNFAYREGGNVTKAKDGKSLVELNQLTNFTNYNTPQPGGWLNKYN